MAGEVAVIEAQLRANTSDFNRQMGGAQRTAALSAAAIARSFSQAQRAFFGFTHSVRNVGHAITGVESALVDAGKKMTVALSTPIQAFRTASVKAFADFENDLNQIVGLVGVARGEVDAMGQSLLRMADSGKGADELGKALFFVTSAGARGADALSIVNASARAATAGLGETVVVADAVTSAINAFGKENISASSAVDVLVATVREGKAAADQIAPALGRVIPIAAELGVSFDEVGAAIAAMTRVGFSADEAVTSLRGIMVKFIRPTEQAKEALAGVGLTMADIQETLETGGLLAAFTQLTEAFKGDQEGLASVLEDVQALTGLLALMGENADETRAIFGSLAESSGAAADAFNAVDDSIWFRVKEALSNAKNVLIAFGDAFAPRFSDMIDKVNRLAEVLIGLPKPIKDLIVSFASLISKIGPATLLFGKLIGFGLRTAAVSFLAAKAVGAFQLAVTLLNNNLGNIRNTLASFLLLVEGAGKAMATVSNEGVRDFGQQLNNMPLRSTAEKLRTMTTTIGATEAALYRVQGASNIFFSTLISGARGGMLTALFSVNKLTHGMNRAALASTILQKAWQGTTGYLGGQVAGMQRGFSTATTGVINFLRPTNLIPRTVNAAGIAFGALTNFIGSTQGKFAIAMVAIQLLVTQIKKLEETAVSSIEAAEKLAESVGLVTQELQELGDLDTTVTLTFQQANASAIRQLREASMLDREQILMEIGLSLQLTGASNEDITAALQRLVDAAGVPMLPIEFTIDPRDAKTQAETAMGGIEDALSGIDFSFLAGNGNFFNGLDDWLGTLTNVNAQERLSGIAQQVAALSTAAGSAQPAIDAITQITLAAEEMGVEGSGAVNFFIDELIRGFGEGAGMSMRNANDLDSAMKELAVRFNDTGYQTAAQAEEFKELARTTAEASRVAEAAGFVPSNTGAMRQRLQELEGSYEDLETAVDETKQATRELLDEQQNAVSPFLSLIRSNNDAARSVEDYDRALEDLREAQKAQVSESLSAADKQRAIVDAQRAVEDSALRVAEAELAADAAFRQLASSPQEVTKNFAQFKTFMEEIAKDNPKLAERYAAELKAVEGQSDDLLTLLRELDEANPQIDFTVEDNLDSTKSRIEGLRTTIDDLEATASEINLKTFLKIDRETIDPSAAAAAANRFAAEFDRVGNQALSSAGEAGIAAYFDSAIREVESRDVSSFFPEDVPEYLRTNFASAGEQAADALVDTLERRKSDVLAIARGYSSDLTSGLGPLLSSLGIRVAGVNSFGGITQADGSILTQYANGGISEQHVAQIAPPGAMRLWAEPETGGEAYIPLSIGKRPRSEQILQQVATKFGYEMHQFADGGLFTKPSDVPRPPSLRPAGPPLTSPAEDMMDRAYAGAKEFVTAPPLGTGIGYQAMMQALHTRFPGLPLISGLRPGAITATGNPSYHGKGRAVDIPPRMDVNHWIYQHYKRLTKELIFSPAGGKQVRNGADHVYSGITRAMHFDHIHWAMENGGILDNGVLKYDNGGMLMPGTTLAVNNTGRPEPVFTGAQMASASVPSADTTRSVVESSNITIAEYLQSLIDILNAVAATAPEAVDAIAGVQVAIHHAAQVIAQDIVAAAAAGTPLTDLAHAIEVLGTATISASEQAGYVTGITDQVAQDSGVTQFIIDEANVQGTVAAIEDAIAALDALEAMWEEQDRINEEIEQRNELWDAQKEAVAEVARAQEELNKASSADERERAQEEVNRAKEAEQRATQDIIDFDVEAARAAEERAIAEQRASLEVQLARQQEIEANRQAAEFAKMSSLEQIRYLAQQQQAVEEYTDAWQDLQDQIDQVTEQLISDAQREVDRALADLNRLLDERQAILDRMTQAEKNAEDRRVQARKNADKRILDAQQRVQDRTLDLIDERGRALSEWARLDERVVMGWGNTLAAVLENGRSQLEQFFEWQRNLDTLRSRGLSESVISRLGLDDPNSLATVRQFTAATDAEIAQLNDIVAQQQLAAAEYAAREAELLVGAVGRGILEAERQLARELDTIERELAEEIENINEELADELARLADELQAIALDAGRTISEAIAEGLASGIPGILAAVAALEAALATLNVTKIAADLAAGGGGIQNLIPFEITKPVHSKSPGGAHQVTTPGGAVLVTQPNGSLVPKPSSLPKAPQPGAGLPANVGNGSTASGHNLPFTIPSVGQARNSAPKINVSNYVSPLKLPIFDSGGRWPSGTMGLNLSGQAETVFTDAQLRGLIGQTTSLMGSESGSEVTVVVINEIDGKEISRTVTREQVKDDRMIRIRQGKSGWR